MTIAIADGRGALWQWDTGRRVKITDGVGVKQIHYQNRCFREKTGGVETYKIAQMGNAVRGTGDQIAHADIPSYVKAEALEVAKKVQAVRTADSIVFVAASDAHQLDTSADIVSGNKHAGMALKALSYILPGIDFCCYLGDYTWGASTTTIAEMKRHITEINKDIDEAFRGMPQFRTVGNHDAGAYAAAQNGATISDAELYQMIGKYCDGATFGSTTAGYCYRDFENKKLRRKARRQRVMFPLHRRHGLLKR